MTPNDRRKLETMLAELITVIEDFLRTGLSTASETTRQTLHVTFQEASRLRLLRLGSTLRLANDEMGKLVRNDVDFSRSRFAFFLNRTWLLARGLLKALQAGDDAAFDRLLWMPPSEPFDRIEVAVLGVVKKVVPRTFVAFDFRLRLVAAVHPSSLAPLPRRERGRGEGRGMMQAGQRLSWSCVFPLKPDQDIPAEAFLHLPHKQKFTASQFLEGKVIVLEKVAVALDDFAGGRLSLGEQSTVQVGDEVDDHDRYLAWDVARASERLEKHEPSPFELDVELQEEIVLRDWVIGDPEPREAEKQVWYPITASGIALTGVVSAQDDGKAHRTFIDEIRKKKPAPLFGLLHYEKCRLMFQPLTLFGPSPQGERGRGEGRQIHLMLSPEKVDRATLLRALKW